MKYEDILTYFPTKQKRTDQYHAMACCPAHLDKDPSLSISYDPKTRSTLLYCFAGCTDGKNGKNDPTPVCEAVGLKVSDLFDDDKTIKQDPIKAYEKYVLDHHPDLSKLITLYDYFTTEGEYAFTRARFAKMSGGKQMLYARRVLNADGSEWIQGKLGKPVKSFGVTYYSPDLRRVKDAIQNGETVFYTEGEKDAGTVNAFGLPAITCGGADDWREECKAIFSGADVVILGDNDSAGTDLTRQVSRDLKGTAKRIRIVIPCKDIDHGDVTDFVEHGGTRAQLLDLVEGAPEDLPLDRFHKIDAKGKVSGVLDVAIRDYIKSIMHIRVFGSDNRPEKILYIYHNGVFTRKDADAILKHKIESCLYREYVKDSVINGIYKLFLSDPSLRSSPEEMNRYDVSWINFKNGMYDPATRTLHPHSPKYLSLTQIPHEYDPNANHSGEIVDSWLSYFSEQQRKMLLQFAGYCLTRSTKAQKMLILCGPGATGKSVVLHMFDALVGRDNRSGVPLGHLKDRFCSFELLGKLLNSCADLAISPLDELSVEKQAIAGDEIRGEAKGFSGVTFRPYAKFIFSANELPIVKNEKTDGFFRRQYIIKMEKPLEKVDKLLEDKLTTRTELDYFLHLAMLELQEVVNSGYEIAESDESKKINKEWRKKSDTIAAFLDEATEKDPAATEKRSDFYKAYENYCFKMERTPHKKSVFFEALSAQGINCRDHRDRDGNVIIKGYSIMPIEWVFED